MAGNKPGLFVLINNRDFDANPSSPRIGTEIDQIHLVHFFSNCGFTVAVYENRSYSDILDILEGVRSDENLASYQCLVLAILSHGTNGFIYGTDAQYDQHRQEWLPKVPIRLLLHKFSAANCDALENKPKIFIIQACRGGNECVGEEVEEVTLSPIAPPTEDSHTNGLHDDTGAPIAELLATHGTRDTAGTEQGADNDSDSSEQTWIENLIVNGQELAEPEFLIAYATSKGDVAFRDRSTIGSWYVHALMQVLNKYGPGEGLLSNLTRVNRFVAYLFSDLDAKQMPSFVSTLTKDLRFTLQAAPQPQLVYPDIHNIGDFKSIKGRYVGAEKGKRNVCLIINNMKFDSTILSERTGSGKDAELLTDLFENVLKFEVINETNLTRTEMIAACNSVAQRDHTGRSCVVCIVLTYSTGREIHAKDESLSIDDLMAPFTGRLVGKPKFFIFQACDSTQVSDTVPTSDVTVKYRIPVVADFLTSFSSIPGKLAWENGNDRGSWFIQTLVSVFKEYHEREDVLTMLTRVNKQLTYLSPSVAYVMSQLTKDFFLNLSSVDADTTPGTGTSTA